MEDKDATIEPPGDGTAWIDQATPFHRSASGICIPEEVSNDPTAIQAFAALHDTPDRVVVSV